MLSEQIQYTVATEVTEALRETTHQTYLERRRLFEAQPASVQRFMKMQARTLGEAVIKGLSHVRFRIPDCVVLDLSGHTAPVPARHREHHVGSWITSLNGTGLSKPLHNHLAELESAGDPAVAMAGKLIGYAAAYTMVHDLLPSGHAVAYRAVDGETIPFIPISWQDEAPSALMAPSDAITEESAAEGARGKFVVPYVPSARRFYLPQWAAFDEDGQLLVSSLQEAESMIASMQRFLSILDAVVSLAPYMIADEEYQRKRYGIVGQLVNQGRALAAYQMRKIIATIRRRAAANDLNRGLSLSLPYFDDQALQIRLRDFQVIPSGHIMFIPAFVVNAVVAEQAKVAQDARMSASTAKYLLQELDILGEAFLSDSELHK